MAGLTVYEPDEEDGDVDSLPWAVTFEARVGEEWASFLCGPYDRAEAIELAESVLAQDSSVSAVVEPLMPVESAQDVLDAVAEMRADEE
ncbi:hypothetical protein GCM10022243_24210 [Saccharothrix violaceirubra]|uniref:Uncharacterized protein n=1 Tax=Saccharothrix violaceirubra TaxID=413306 RepID=A0A7W7T7A7_9PSEU|nr:hypothetical protein [Saccharothrix violaceirubra]MBB4967866.1 hypothetical protein [Saccharothrix violaceirubra]